ncbi:MAG TPA: class I adenylate-forming enzyme family protein, partial [Tepidisphaeraceae bacterium]|nr:class I adenylate-forming enzyme family protein [Tepidisphaeraceae bacterium]
MAARDGARVAYVDAHCGATLSYADLWRHARTLAASLTRDLPAGATVLLQSGNTLAFPIWFLAIVSGGLNCLPVHPDLTETELRDLAARTKAVAIAGCEGMIERLGDSIRLAMPLSRCWGAQQLNKHATVEKAGPTPGSERTRDDPDSSFFARQNPARRSTSEPGVAGADPFQRLHGHSDLLSVAPGSLLLSSSGTTGLPKVVWRSAVSLDAVSDAIVAAIGFRADDIVLASVPLSHSYGIEHGLLAPLWAGSTVHLCDGFNIAIIARALAERATIFPAVPAVIDMLATLNDVPATMPKLRLAYSAGGMLPAAVHERFAQRFGTHIGQVYGMTEIGSVTFSDPRSADFSSDSVGRPMHGVSIRILDADPGADGEVAVRSPFMLDRYVDEEALLIDGHFRTGDIGRIDARGELRITGRVRLLIEVGGRKVNPLEVEAVLSSHPDVNECVVVAMKQTDTIHRLRAVLVAR